MRTEYGCARCICEYLCLYANADVVADHLLNLCLCHMNMVYTAMKTFNRLLFFILVLALTYERILFCFILNDESSKTIHFGCKLMQIEKVALPKLESRHDLFINWVVFEKHRMKVRWFCVHLMNAWSMIKFQFYDSFRSRRFDATRSILLHRIAYVM